MTKSASQIAIEALDEVARRHELKWGIGRLPRVVPQDLAAKFHSQAAKLNAAIEDQVTGGGWEADDAVILHANRMQNAWMALDASAEAAGADPLVPGYMEGRLPDGRLLIVCSGPESAHRMANDNRAAVVWSMEEICRVLWNFEMVNDAKMVWPGAKVEQVRVDPERTKPPVDWKHGDDLPQSLLGAG